MPFNTNYNFSILHSLIAAVCSKSKLQHAVKWKLHQINVEVKLKWCFKFAMIIVKYENTFHNLQCYCGTEQYFLLNNLLFSVYTVIRYHWKRKL